MRRALLCLLALAACSDEDDAEPLAVVEESTTTTVEDALAIDRCADLPDRLARPVDGPLDDDPEVAGWQRERARQGMASDEASTLAAAEAPTDPERQSYAFPMTRDEFDDWVLRQQQASAAAQDAGEALGGRSELGATAVDNATGQVVISTTGDVAALQAELDAAIGAGRARVEPVAAGEAELSALGEEVRVFLDASDIEWAGLGAGNAYGRVMIGLAVLDAQDVAAIADEFAAEVELLCVGGADPADVVPNGPQPEAGDGWRLLADEPGIGLPYDTGFAAHEAAYEALWDEIGLTGEPPPVDFEDEVVVYFGPAVSGSCADIRMDDVTVEDGVVEPLLVLPGGNRACTSDANPHAYVVAMARDRLPPRFTISVRPDGASEQCCPEASTDVEL